MFLSITEVRHPLKKIDNKIHDSIICMEMN